MTDLSPFLEASDVVDFRSPEVRALSDELGAAHGSGEYARACFEWVRDRIVHTFDGGPRVVTCVASDVLRARTGICHAKSHLLVALLRARGVPAAFGYQRLRSDGPTSRLVLHGFVHLWVRDTGRFSAIDARGNNTTVSTRFDLATPSLAYVPDPTCGEATLPDVYGRPSARVVEALRGCRTPEELSARLPSEP